MGDFDLAFFEVEMNERDSHDFDKALYMRVGLTSSSESSSDSSSSSSSSSSSDDSSDKEVHKKHHHKHRHHHHKHHKHDSEKNDLDKFEQKLRDDNLEIKLAQTEHQMGEVLKKNIKENDIIQLTRLFDLGVNVNGHGLLLYASKIANVDFEVIKMLIDKQASLDSSDIKQSDIIRNFIFNGRDDAFRLIHSSYQLNFEEDDSTEAIALDLSSVKLSDAQKNQMINCLFEAGHNFPPTEEGMKFSQIMKALGCSKEVVSHAKEIEKKVLYKTPFLKRLFKR